MRREIYCQIQGRCCSKDEEQLMVIWEMKKKNELYGLEKCSNASGIKCNSTKVKDHVLRSKGISAISWELISDIVEERCGCVNQSQNDSEQPL